jgi:hypothetical protein
MKRFELSNYQKYFKLVALFYKKRLSKYTAKGVRTREALEYHHVRPLSIYGGEDNLVVAVPGRVHTKLHWLLWQHYAEKGMTLEAAKMEYAYRTLCERHKMAALDETFIPYVQIERQYKYLVHRFPLYDNRKENEVAK